MSKYLRFIFAVLITLASVATAPAALGQRADTKSFTSKLTGAVVEITASSDADFDRVDYEIDRTRSGYAQESILILHGLMQYWVIFVDGDVNPQKWQDESFAIFPTYYNLYVDHIASEVTEDEGWYLLQGTWGLNQKEAHYSEYYQNFGNGLSVVVSFYSHPSDAVNQAQWVQGNLTINGEHVYQDLDPSEIGAMLDGTADVQPERWYGFMSDVDDWADDGLRSETEWVSPVSGSTVTWNDPHIIFPFYYESPIGQSDTSDSLMLTAAKTEDVGYIQFFEVNIDFGQQIEERWISEDWLAEMVVDYPALDSKSTGDSAAIFTTYEAGYNEPLIFLQETRRVDSDLWVGFRLTGHEATFIESYVELTANILIDGEPLEPMWTIAELEELVPNANQVSDSSGDTSETSRDADESNSDDAQSGRSSRSSRTTASPEAADWPAMGLDSDTEWQSPNTGTSFTWDGTTWMFPPDRPDAIQIGDELNTLTLVTTDGRGEVNLSTDTGGIPINVWFQYLVSDDWLDTLAAEGTTATVLDSYSDGTTASAIFYLEGADGDQILIVDLWENEDGVTVITEIYATPADIVDVYAAFWDGVQSNGEYYPLTWTIEDITSLELE